VTCRHVFLKWDGAPKLFPIVITLSLTVFQRYKVGRKHYAMTALNPLEVKKLRPLPAFLIWSFCAGLVFVALFPFVVVMIAWVTKTSGPVMSFIKVLIPLFILNRVSGKGLAASL
jgi:hypothetical protein